MKSKCLTEYVGAEKRRGEKSLWVRQLEGARAVMQLIRPGPRALADCGIYVMGGLDHPCQPIAPTEQPERQTHTYVNLGIALLSLAITVNYFQISRSSIIIASFRGNGCVLAPPRLYYGYPIAGLSSIPCRLARICHLHRHPHPTTSIYRSRHICNPP